jgi:hypothetical protein
MTSCGVRFWDTKKISDTSRGRYRVRWAVDGREHCKSFTTKALADAFLVTLKDAARTSQPDPAEISRALDWITKASLPVAALEDPDTVRSVLGACARRLDGKPAAATTPCSPTRSATPSNAGCCLLAGLDGS